MQILDKAVFVGPSLYAHFPVIRLDIDLGPLEEWPSGKLGPAFTDALLAALPGLARARLLLRQAGRLRPPAHRGRGHLDGPHPGARGHRAAERGRRDRSPSARPASHGPPGHYYVVYQYEQEDVGLEAGQLGAHPAPLAAPTRAPARGLGAAGVRLRAPSGTSSSALPSGARSGPAPWRWCARPRSGGFPGSGSTTRA